MKIKNEGFAPSKALLDLPVNNTSSKPLRHDVYEVTAKEVKPVDLTTETSHGVARIQIRVWEWEMIDSVIEVISVDILFVTALMSNCCIT